MSLKVIGFTVIALAGATTAGAQTYEWGGFVADNAWGSEFNWMLNGNPVEDVPGCNGLTGASAIIGPGVGPITVKCGNGGNVQVNSLVSESTLLVDCTLTLNSDSSFKQMETLDQFGLVANALLEIADDSSWKSGFMRGSGFVVVTDNLWIEGAGPRLLQLDLNVPGSVQQLTDMTLQPDAASGGSNPVITCTGDWYGTGTISRMSSPLSAFSLENGTVHSLGLLRFTLPMNITGGTANGSIRFSGGGTHSGTGQYVLQRGEETIIDLVAGATPLQITGNYSATGGGSIRLNNALTIATQGVFKPNLTSGNGFYLDNGALLIADGDFENQGLMTWKAGTYSSAFVLLGTTQNKAGGTVRIIPGGNSMPTLNALFQNAGTWRQEADCTIGGSGTLVTTSGGTLDMRSGRVLGPGPCILQDGALLLRPIDAPPGNTEIVAPCQISNAQVISESGELRFSGGGMLQKATLEAQEGAQITLRSLSYSTPDVRNETVTFAGTGEVSVRNGAVLQCGQLTNSQLGQGNSGVFRLGTDGTGGAISGTAFRNHGEFRWRSGTIGLVPEDQLWNLGTFRTEAANNSVRGLLFNTIGPASAGVFLDHHTQVQAGGIILNSPGTVTQTNSTLTLVAANSLANNDSGNWKLVGSSNINGAGTLALGSDGTLRKQGAGSTSTISAVVSANDSNGAGHVAVESGTLVISSPIAGVKGVFWSIANGAVLSLTGQTYTMGQDPNSSIVDEIDGVVSLGIVGTDPPRFELGTLNAGGIIRPGGLVDTGELVIDANVNLLSEGLLSINLKGDVAGLTHDLLTVEGNVTLGGAMEVHLLDGYTPTPGQSFTILTATGTVGGQFDEVAGDGVCGIQTVGHDVIITLVSLPIVGDINGDGDVNGADLGLLLSAWGSCRSCNEDLNGDGAVNGADLGILLANWGSSA